MPWIGMLRRSKEDTWWMVEYVEKKIIGRKDRQILEGGKEMWMCRINRLIRFYQILCLASGQNNMVAYSCIWKPTHAAQDTRMTKEEKRCQTPDCSKKRNLWWLISDSTDIWTQKKGARYSGGIVYVLLYMYICRKCIFSYYRHFNYLEIST